MTKDEARKALLETLEEYCHDKGYNFQVFAGLSDLVYTLYPKKKAMTNREWLAQMPDKQFIKWLRKYKYKTDACGLCEFKGKCPLEDCNECESLWLKQEHVESNSTLTRL